MTELCTCTDYNCQWHPRNHDQGCTLCITKNLKTKEIPACYFHLLEGAEEQNSFYLEDFAKLVLKDKA